MLVLDIKHPIPSLLAQVNFFQQCEVTLQGYATMFDITPKYSY